MESNAYQDLKAWKRGMALVDEVYKLARTFPESEFEQEDSVGNRLKRAVIAIPAKIANGYGRGSRAAEPGNGGRDAGGGGGARPGDGRTDCRLEAGSAGRGN